MARDTRAGGAYVELGLRAKLDKGLNKASAKLRAFGKNAMKFGAGLTGAGAGLIAPIVGAATKFASVGDEIGKMAKRTGIGSEALQELGFAAKQSGTSLDEVENGTKRMQRVVNDAANGLQGAQRSLEQINLSPEQLAGKSTEEQLMMISEALAGVDDAGRKAAIAQEIFGRSGTMMLPLFNEGPEGLAALRKEARELGLVLSDSEIADAEKLTDAFGRAGSAFKAIFLKVGAAISAPFEKVLNVSAQVFAKVSGYIADNKKQFLSILTIFATVGGGLIALGGVITSVGAAVFASGVILPILSAGLAAIGSAISAVLGPGLLIVGVIAAIGSAAYHYRDAIVEWGQAFWDTIKPVRDAAAELWSIVTDTFGGISDAISAGNYSQAVAFLWARLKLLFFTGAGQAVQAVSWLREQAIGIFESIWASITSGASTAVSILGQTFGRVVGVVGSIGGTIGDVFSTTFDWLGGALGELFDNFKTTFGGIVSAISAGDIGLAAEILWASIQLAFVAGIGAVKKLWSSFTLGLAEVWSGTIHGIVDVFRSMVSAIVGVVAQSLQGWQQLTSALAQYDPTGTVAAISEGLGTAGEFVDIMQQDITARQKSAEETRNRQQLARGQAHLQDIEAIERKTAEARARRDKLVDQANQASGEITLDGLQASSREKLDKLLAEVKAEAEAADSKVDDVEEQKSDTDSAGDQVANKTKGATSGTFSAAGAALLGLGGNNAPQQETARNTKRMVFYLERIARRKAKPIEQPTFE